MSVVERCTAEEFGHDRKGYRQPWTERVSQTKVIDFVLTGNDIQADFEAGRSIRIFLRNIAREIARFEIDRSEMQAALEGRFSLQSFDGFGHGLSIDAYGDGLRIRIENAKSGTRICQVAKERVEQLIAMGRVGV